MDVNYSSIDFSAMDVKVALRPSDGTCGEIAKIEYAYYCSRRRRTYRNTYQTCAILVRLPLERWPPLVGVCRPLPRFADRPRCTRAHLYGTNVNISRT